MLKLIRGLCCYDRVHSSMKNSFMFILKYREGQILYIVGVNSSNEHN